MATTSDRKRGFVPTRSITGAQTFRQSLYPVSANYGTGLFIGDPIVLSGGRAQVWTTAAAASFVGIATAFYDSNKKPLTFSQPGRGPYLPPSTGGFVSVVDDPNVTFTVELAVSAGPSVVGQVILLEASAGNTATGVSRYFAAGVTASDTSSNFRVVAISPNELDGLGGTGNDIEVVPIIHLYK